MKSTNVQEQKIISDDMQVKEQETKKTDETKDESGHLAEVKNEIALMEQYTIGISMPKDELSQWEDEGNSLESYLCGEGCQVELSFSETAEKQSEIIGRWIREEVDMLIVNPVDAYGLKGTLEEAAKLGIPVISYHELIMNSSAVSYLMAENQYVTGKMQGQFYVERNGISMESEESFEIWFIREGEEKGSSKLLYEGLTETLLPYIDAGVIMTRTMVTEMAIEEMEKLIRENKDLPSSVFCMDTAGTVTFGKYLNGESVLVNGENVSWKEEKVGDIQLIGVVDNEAQGKTLLSQKDNMLVCTNGEKKAEVCGKLVKKILLGQTPETEFLQIDLTEAEKKNWSFDRGNYDNGTGIIPAYLLAGEMMSSSF